MCYGVENSPHSGKGAGGGGIWWRAGGLRSLGEEGGGGGGGGPKITMRGSSGGVRRALGTIIGASRVRVCEFWLVVGFMCVMSITRILTGVVVVVGVGVLLLRVVLCEINEIGVLLNALLIPKEKGGFVREEEKGRGKGKWGII